MWRVWVHIGPTWGLPALGFHDTRVVKQVLEVTCSHQIRAIVRGMFYYLATLKQTWVNNHLGLMQQPSHLLKSWTSDSTLNPHNSYPVLHTHMQSSFLEYHVSSSGAFWAIEPRQKGSLMSFSLIWLVPQTFHINALCFYFKYVSVAFDANPINGVALRWTLDRIKDNRTEEVMSTRQCFWSQRSLNNTMLNISHCCHPMLDLTSLKPVLHQAFLLWV